MFKFFLFFCCFFFSSFNLFAENIGSDTGYRIPRFVSLKSNETNLRIGSSTNYPIILKYIIKSLPVEVNDEYHVWRKINDIEGNEGWIHKTLLKGERFAIIKQSNKPAIHVYSKPKGKIIGEVGKYNIVKINTCLDQWCKINFNKNNGWINKEYLWGVYKNEKINVPFYQPLINQIWKIKF